MQLDLQDQHFQLSDSSCFGKHAIPNLQLYTCVSYKGLLPRQAFVYKENELDGRSAVAHSVSWYCDGSNVHTPSSSHERGNYESHSQTFHPNIQKARRSSHRATGHCVQLVSFLCNFTISQEPISRANNKNARYTVNLTFCLYTFRILAYTIL